MKHKQIVLFCFLICKQSLYTSITPKLKNYDCKISGFAIYVEVVIYSLLHISWIFFENKQNRKKQLQQIRVNIMCVLMKFSQLMLLNFTDQVKTTFIIRTCITIQIPRIELTLNSWNTWYWYIRYSFFFHALNNLKPLCLCF